MPASTTVKIAAGAIRRGIADAWLVQERRVSAATGGTISFFGGAYEEQDSSMRDTMQRESAEELVLMSKHGRPSRHPIQYGAEIATVNLFNFEIHLFVAQIEGEADVRPSETEQRKTVAIHWLPLAALLTTSDARMMPSTRLLAACIANIPRGVLHDFVRSPSSLFATMDPRGWSRQQRMRPARITATSDRRTVSTYLHRYATMAVSDGMPIVTYAEAEDALVGLLHRCAAGRMKMCDVWELLSFSAHQLRMQHVDSPEGPSRATGTVPDRDPPAREPGSEEVSCTGRTDLSTDDGGTAATTVTVGRPMQVDSSPSTPDRAVIWYVADFLTCPDSGVMGVRLCQNGWLENDRGRQVCVLTTVHGQERAGQPLDTICVGDTVKIVSFEQGDSPPLMAVLAVPSSPVATHADLATAWTGRRPSTGQRPA